MLRERHFPPKILSKNLHVSKKVKNTLGKVLPGNYNLICYITDFLFFLGAIEILLTSENKSKNAPAEKELPCAPQDNLSRNPTSMANASSSTDKLVSLNRCPSLNPAAFEPYSKPKLGMTIHSNLQKPDSTTVFSANEPTSDEINGRASLMNQFSSIFYSNPSLKKELFPRESFKHVETSGQSTSIGNRGEIVAAAVVGNSSMKNTNMMSSNGSRPSGLRMPSRKMGFFDISPLKLSWSSPLQSAVATPGPTMYASTKTPLNGKLCLSSMLNGVSSQTRNLKKSIDLPQYYLNAENVQEIGNLMNSGIAEVKSKGGPVAVMEVNAIYNSRNGTGFGQKFGKQ